MFQLCVRSLLTLAFHVWIRPSPYSLSTPQLFVVEAVGVSSACWMSSVGSRPATIVSVTAAGGCAARRRAMFAYDAGL